MPSKGSAILLTLGNKYFHHVSSKSFILNCCSLLQYVILLYQREVWCHDAQFLMIVRKASFLIQIGVTVYGWKSSMNLDYI